MKTLVYNSKKGLEENFAPIGANLNEIHAERIANGEEITIIELITEFKMDLENLSNKDYEKKVPEIKIKGIPEHIKEQVIKYLDLLIERHEKKEKIALQKKAKNDKKNAKKANFDERMNQVQELIEKIGLQEGIPKSEAIKRVIDNLESNMAGIEFTKKERTQIIKKLSEIRQKEIEREERENKESTRRENKVNNIWNQICGIVQKESEKENKNKKEKKNEAKYWIAVRDKFFRESQSSMGKTVAKRISKLLSDEIYYQEVKYFTDNFSFLREYSEIVMATSGRFSRKFTDLESYDRYCALRERLSHSINNEEDMICKLLKEEGLNDADRRILTERMKVIEKERSKKSRDR